jgi:uncharacterized protein DUF3179
MHRRRPAILLLACLAISLFFVAYPLYVIRPFRPQGSTELALALIAARYSASVTAVCAIAAIAAVWFSRKRIVPAIAALLVCGLAVFAQVNIFELIFHPIPTVSFSSAQSTGLSPREKVIAIRLGNAARAYPVRAISYHHIVNDTVDKFAIVATY